VSIEKYLKLYAESDIQGLDDFGIDRLYGQVVVIPACNESAHLLEILPQAKLPSLLVVVVNEPYQTSCEVRENNQKLMNLVRDRGHCIWKSKAPWRMFLHDDAHSDQDILLIDRCAPNLTLAADGGVGQARKIGADLALSLIEQGKVNSPWIFNTDADVCLPSSYFSAVAQTSESKGSTAALLYPFTHDSKHNNKIRQATLLYEFSLLHYEHGLKQANSPYAFQTVGSCFAVHAQAYAKVRGFPKRAAAEDFYMLNKLAKLNKPGGLGCLFELACEPIIIQARISDRVPFGTGAAVNQMMEFENPVAQYSYYDPWVFDYLKLLINSLSQVWNESCDDMKSLRLVLSSQAQSHIDQHLLVDALQMIGFSKALKHVFKQSKTEVQFNKQIHDWFDAFKTLKLIHRLRDQAFPMITLSDLLSRNDYLMSIKDHLPMQRLLEKINISNYL